MTTALRIDSERRPDEALEELLEKIKRLEGEVGSLRDENRTLQEKSHTDDLTGLANRRGFQAALATALGYVHRYGGSVSLLAIDLDGMKRLNDTLGHLAGDDALRRTGEILASTIRSADTAARLGGDEFAVLLQATPNEGAQHVAERVRRLVAALRFPADIALTTSIGFITLSDGEAGIGADAFISIADAALYRAKRRGKNRIEKGDRPRRITATTPV